jgi:Flp pilus assembly protein TadG
MTFIASWRDQRGSPAVEFALIFPILIVLMLGLGDLAFQGYLQSVLTGAVQKAGRDTTIQGKGIDSETAKIDAKVINAIKAISPTANVVATRTNYDNYEAVGPEPFVDGNNDGICNNNESYSDYNADGAWDSNQGSSGAGGASDVTLYKMTVTYPRLFPIARLIGWGATQTLTASTLLKNQPYQTQTTVTPTKKNCP